MNITKKLVETLTYSAGNDVQVDLPTEGIITRIAIEMAITASGASAAALSVAGLWRAIQNIKITGGGGKSYFSMTGKQMGMMLHHVNLTDFPGRSWREIVATTQTVAAILHFGSRQRDVYGRDNPYDLTAAIPAQDETNLKLTWTCAASDDSIDDTNTISSGTMRITVHEVLGQSTEGLMIPISSSESYDPGSTKSDLQGERDIPTGNYVRRIVIMALDATAGSSGGPDLKDDQVTEIGIKLVRENRRLIEVRAKALELFNPLWDGMQVVDTPNTLSPHNFTGGLYVLDLRQIDHPDYGLDTRRMNTGDVKLALTIGAYAAGETEHIWYDQVQAYAGRGL
ncbi:hypothetical protein LCGC14_0632150 [marine sediment metagenome]|uniref:Uncharacterized protein n=1 Tax=marine sediment metagenome TaxID=412755 RepID=A0A0F9R1K2_9ZZZZ